MYSFAKSLVSLIFILSGIEAGASRFVVPIEGVAYKDWTIVNYVDRDPSAGIVDYRGGTYTYDGHDAIDFTLANFAAMDRGYDVYAAAAGTVVAVHDGEFDRCSRVTPCGDAANYVTIDHGNGLTTDYYHFAKDSIRVSVGQAVSAGEAIGLVGSSGLSTDPHLHFAVRQDGVAVDTSVDPQNWWIDPLAYAGDKSGVLDFGFTDHVPTLAELVERPADATGFAAGDTSYMWLNLFGTKAGDRLSFSWYRPDGSRWADWSWIVSEIHYGWWTAGSDLGATPEAGRWRVTAFLNGAEIASDTFNVAAVPEPTSWLTMIAGFLAVGAIMRRRSLPALA